MDATGWRGTLPEMNYNETVRLIESRSIMPDGPPSLDKMHRAYERLQSLLNFDSKKVILVAGTNGKGSVCATLEALLLSAGERVGTYTSPHLEQTTERFRIQGEDISEEVFCSAYEKVAELTEDLDLTHFEILTAMALLIFYAEPKVDWGIFEIGLGGLWDATNAIPHHTSVITALGMDHQNLLGDTLSEIAANKFGIIRSGNNVIHAPLPDEVRELALEVQRKTGTQWRQSIPFDLSIRASEIIDFDSPTHPKFDEPTFYIHTQWGSAQLTLPGQRGAENAATALTVFESLGFNPARHLTALRQVRWAARMERFTSSGLPCPVYLSGDHNIQGVGSLLSLLEHYHWKHLHIICGIGKDKDADPMLDSLFGLSNSSVYLTETPFRGRPVEAYGKFLARAAGASSDASSLFEEIRQKAEPDDLILITGSLYLAGAMRTEIRERYGSA